jgi:N-acetylneuraminic acid mutarotase
LLKDVYALKLSPEVGKAWEKITELPNRRRSVNVMVAGSAIHIFGGFAEGGASGIRTTAIDTVDTKTKKSGSETVRLPLGVEGARMCWAGDDLLLIGGKRDGEKPDANVLLLDFEKKAIMSLR